MAQGYVAVALGTDHTQLIVVLLEVVGYDGGIPTIFTTPRAKRHRHFIILHLSTPESWGTVDPLDSHTVA